MRDFAQYVNSDPRNIVRFRQSLKRVFILKAKIAMSIKENVDDLLSNKLDSWKFNVAGPTMLCSIPLAGGLVNSDQIAKSVLKSSYVLINHCADYDISNISSTAGMSFFIAPNGIETFKNRLGDRFPKSHFFRVPVSKTKQEFDKLYTTFVKSLMKDSRVFLTLVSVDDAKLVQSACEQFPKQTQEKSSYCCTIRQRY